MTRTRVPRRLLVLAPHTDDAELGMGGSIARFTEQGDNVHVAVFSSCAGSLPPDMGEDALQKELFTSLPKLGIRRSQVTLFGFPARRFPELRQQILDELIKLKARVKPQVVFLPSRHDVHQDHQTMFWEGMRAFKGTTVFGYELPWNNTRFDAQSYCAFERRHLTAKLAALRCYRTQLVLKRPYFQPAYLESWSRFRGLQAGGVYGEAFEVERMLLQNVLT